MDYIAKTAALDKETADCVIVGLFNPRKLSPSARKLDALYRGTITQACQRGIAKSALGQAVTLHNSNRSKHAHIIVVGCGDKEHFSAHAFQKALSAGINEAKKCNAGTVINSLVEMPVKQCDLQTRVQASVLSSEAAMYRYTHTKPKAGKARRSLKKMKFLASQSSELAILRQGKKFGQAIAAGMNLTKDLGNLPGNICTPAYLAEQALALKDEYPQLRVTVLEEPQMEKLGMGALLSVSHGSVQPAKLVTMEYQGGLSDARPAVLVGKGITFDTGGISLKPGSAMDEMKFDMCGAGSVLGTLKACCAMNIPLNVVGVIACAENMPGGKASRPGDVVTTMSGQTVEILNTDAEGRLVLCDALTYIEKFDPQTVIDIATLTGACIVALGHVPSGLMSNDEPLVEDLYRAGDLTGDRTWRLPLWDDYQSQLDSNFADMANIGGRWAGTITAACFLSRFTEKYRWAHLDIAGVAWHSQGKQKGATGRPVPLLTQYLLSQAYPSGH